MPFHLLTQLMFLMKYLRLPNDKNIRWGTRPLAKFPSKKTSDESSAIIASQPIALSQSHLMFL